MAIGSPHGSKTLAKTIKHGEFKLVLTKKLSLSRLAFIVPEVLCRLLEEIKKSWTVCESFELRYGVERCGHGYNSGLHVMVEIYHVPFGFKDHSAGGHLL